MNGMTLQARCESVTHETADIMVFALRAQGASAEFLDGLRPGRHVAVSYPDTTGTPQQRLYSITRTAAAGLFEIAVKREGHGGVSDQLHATLRAGETAPMHFVAGDICLASIMDRQQVGMLAGGIGITLPIALLRGLRERAQRGLAVPDVALVLCVPSIAQIPFLQELLELELTTAWFTLQVFVTREAVRSNGHFKAGRPGAADLSLLGAPEAVVICGSQAFAQGMREHTTALFPAAALLIESFTPVAAPVAAAEAPSAVRLQLKDSDQVVEGTAGQSLLAMLEAGDIAVRSLCRAGICGVCRVKVSDGDYTQQPDFCLSDQDKQQGYALACCTFPRSGTINVDLNPPA